VGALWARRTLIPVPWLAPFYCGAAREGVHCHTRQSPPIRTRIGSVSRSGDHIPNIKLSTCHSSGVVGSLCLLMSSVMLLIVKKTLTEEKTSSHRSSFKNFNSGMSLHQPVSSRPCSQDGRNWAALADELRKRLVAVLGSVAVRGAVQGPPVHRSSRRIKKRD
jgi:hypothetical protein